MLFIVERSLLGSPLVVVGKSLKLSRTVGLSWFWQCEAKSALSSNIPCLVVDLKRHDALARFSGGWVESDWNQPIHLWSLWRRALKRSTHFLEQSVRRESSGGSLDHKPYRIGFAIIVQISQSLRGTGGTLVAFSQISSNSMRSVLDNWLPARRVQRMGIGGMMKKVLVSVVEDDRSFRESMCRLMRSLGYTVEIFSSATEFLASPRLAETACLIADIHMPVMTGLELYRRLIDTGHAIPTILVTAFPNDLDRARALNDGVVCYLRKPVDEEHLTQCVCAALRSGDPLEADS